MTNPTEPAPDAKPLLSGERDGVLILTLARPQTSNALNGALLQALLRAFEQAANSSCRAIVITGAGKNFCAGADVKAFADDPSSLSLRGMFNPLIQAMRAVEKPIVAALNGSTAGGGIGIALSADFRLLGESARLRPAWGKRGLAPDVGASWFLPRIMGRDRALEWLASGLDKNADEAVALGLAMRVVPDAELVDRAVELAVTLSAISGSAFARTRHLLDSAYSNTLAQQLEAEAIVLDQVVATNRKTRA